MFDLIKDKSRGTIMCDEGEFITDKEEEKQKELEEQARENTPIRKKFREIKNSVSDMKCLIGMLLTAIDNDFNVPKTEEVVSYLEILKKYLDNHNLMLDEFLNELQLPDENAKLLRLSYVKFKD